MATTREDTQNLNNEEAVREAERAAMAAQPRYEQEEGDDKHYVEDAPDENVVEVDEDENTDY
jgi:hypothetical protein